MTNDEAVGQLDALLQQQIPLIVKSLTAALTDGETLRTEVMARLTCARTEQRLATLISSRIELDAWQSEVQSLLHTIGERYGKTEDA